MIETADSKWVDLCRIRGCANQGKDVTQLKYLVMSNKDDEIGDKWNGNESIREKKVNMKKNMVEALRRKGWLVT